MTELGIITTEPMTVAFITLNGPYAQTPVGYGRLYAWIGQHAPAATVASVMHKGPYESVAPTYEMLWRWIGENGYAPDGPPMERYYSDAAEVPPEEYLTEVLMPVRRA